MSNVTTEKLADRVRNLRVLHGYTQEQVSFRLGMSRATYNAIEMGKRDLTVSELASLAIFYDRTIPEFFGQFRSNEKFKQMYFYILSKFRDGIPKTKLAKLLYLADFTNFYEELEPMSGVYYARRQYGPLADCFLELTDELYDEGKISIDKLSEGAFIIKSASMNQERNLLNDKEIKRIDKICRLWQDKSTKEIVNFTHEQKPWASCRDGEYIPYELIMQENPKHVYAPVA